MIRPFIWLAAALLLTPCGVLGQTAPAPTFDVAVIRPAASLQQQIAANALRVGQTITDARVDLQSASLADLVVMAYRIKPFQLSGADWIRNERYDVQATLPPGGNKDQVPEMLQALLAERFKLQIRRDKKEHSVYALAVGNGGHKLKASGPSPQQSDAPPAGTRTLELGGQQVHIAADGRSMSATGANGVAIRASQSSSGTMEMMLSNATLGSFADMLTTFVDRPVVDATGVTGGYDIPFELRQEDLLAAARNAAQQAGVTLPVLPGTPAPGQASDPTGSSIFSSVQKLGLKLDSRRMSVDVIVVESADKLPIAD